MAAGCCGVAVLAFVAAALGIGIGATPNEPVAVDEPQYLMTALSLGVDGDLDIGNQLARADWRRFTEVEPPLETIVQPDGDQLSPHDPLLPLLLAVPTVIGGSAGAKLALSLMAGVLAALTLWVAVRRFGVPLPLATGGVAVASASAPLAVYGQQIYPELPAALACLAGVAALTGAVRRRELVVLGAAIVVLPWLSVKYTPVAGALAVLGLVRWWRAPVYGERAMARHAGSAAERRGRVRPGVVGALRVRRDAVGFGAGLVVLGGVYLLAHRVAWGGWTVYASGDHFQQIGQLGVMGTNPNFLFRSWRLIDLLVDRKFGLVAWQPAWLLVVPAFAVLTVLTVRRQLWRSGLAVLGLPLLAGWLVATYPALTMHGHWWPGRQVVVVLPLALLAVLCWLTHAGLATRVVAALLGLAGVFTYGCVLVDGYSGELAWVNHFSDVDAPVHQFIQVWLADYGTTTSNVVWLGILAVLAATAALHAAVRGRRAGSPSSAAPSTRAQALAGKNEAGPVTVTPTSSSVRNR